VVPMAKEDEGEGCGCWWWWNVVYQGWVGGVDEAESIILIAACFLYCSALVRAGKLRLVGSLNFSS